MQWVGRALSSVSQYYKEINPATLSGAIDVIVVEHKNPKDGSTTLACSPFHVRFGKLSVLRPTDRTVYVRINEKDAPYHMKVGDTGEAFFVFETDQDVPEDLQTSPITGPMSDNEAGNEPELLDLGDSVASLNLGQSDHPKSSTSTDVSEQEKEDLATRHESKTSAFLEGTMSRVQDAGRGAIDAATGSTKLEHLTSKISTKTGGIRGRIHERSSSKDSDLGDPDVSLRSMNKKHAITEEAFVASEFSAGAASSAFDGYTAPFGMNEPTREDDKAQADQQQSTPGYQHDKSASHSSAPSGASSLASVLSQETQHNLIFDMAGYKTQDHDEKESYGLKTPPNLELTALAEGEAVDSANLHPRDLHETDPDIFALTRALLRYAEQRDPDKKEEEAPRLYPVASDPSLDAPALIDAAADPYVFVLVSEGFSYTFEIAVCKDVSVTIREALPSVDEFDATRITNEQFLKEPQILQDQHLFVRFRSRCFGWDNGSPILATLDLYRKALLQSQPRPPAQNASRGAWSRWWNRGSTRSRTPTENTGVSSTKGEAGSSQQGSTASGLQSGEETSTLERSHTEPSLTKHAPPLSKSPSFPLLPSSPTLSQAETVVDNKQDQAVDHPKQYAKTLRLTSDQLKALNLHRGVNTVSFTVQSSYSGVAVISARIFLWDSDFKVVISDIDGTITKSDALGHVFTMIGRDWTHPGVAKLYTDIAKNGYKMLYLTSRAVGQADVTREYLRGIQQGGFTLPEGPVIMSPDRLLTSLHREVVLRKPEAFKMACLRDIKRLFVDRNPFYAGFGNRLTDGLSYRHVEIPSSRIFTIDSYGNVKLELLELAGYMSSYIAMANLVDETFPPAKQAGQPAYNDFNYWRSSLPQVELPDLTPEPVSPALSARSDSSRMSVFRVGAIAGALAKRGSKSQLKTSSTPNDAESSRSPRASSPRSTSPTPLDTVYDSGDEEADFSLEPPTNATRQKQRRNPDSMPGNFEDESYLDQMRDSTELKRNGEDNKSMDDRDVENDSNEGDSDEEEEEGEHNDTLDDDDLPDIDFGSVPYL